jgi:outer membrane biosynthesis protein TonB
MRAWVNDLKAMFTLVDITGDEVFFRETQKAIKKCKFKPAIQVYIGIR